VTWDIAAGVNARGDEQLIRVVLNNLLNNAWKFTSRTSQARIEFGVDSQPERQVFFIRDNGAGFNMEYLGKLFGAFQRLHATSEFEGSGIGLATVQRIIRRHGGEVWAEGEVGRGATFSFTLP
jgi:light-regulated signal transduction histidine kinase (bacteriophytochrome)